jgi:hypothetical protein
MKLFKKQISQKGFNLIEILLILVVMSLMSIGIYIIYRSYSMDMNVKLQIQDLYALNNKISSAYQSSNSLATLNNTNAISKGMVPTELINTPNIMNRFGSTITLSRQLVAGVEGYEILLNNITPKACTAIGTSKYANEVDEIWINGANRKTTGAPLTNTNIVTITAQCLTATSIAFRNRMVFKALPDTYVQTRTNQTNKYYIPTLNSNVISASTACGSGGTWNGSFCSCPLGTEFDGNACTSNLLPLNCAYGTGTNFTTKTCTTLPGTKAQETIYNGTNMITQSVTHYANAVVPTDRTSCNAANGYWDQITGICGGLLPSKTTGTVTAPSPTYQGGRYLPQVMNPAVTALIQDNSVRDASGSCAAKGGHWDGKICNYCPSPNTLNVSDVSTAIVNATTGTSLIPNLASNPTVNPKIVTGHASSSLWDVDRCVTPAASSVPPYPQNVPW